MRRRRPFGLLRQPRPFKQKQEEGDREDQPLRLLCQPRPIRQGREEGDREDQPLRLLRQPRPIKQGQEEGDHSDFYASQDQSSRDEKKETIPTSTPAKTNKAGTRRRRPRGSTTPTSTPAKVNQAGMRRRRPFRLLRQPRPIKQGREEGDREDQPL
jgi:hypothetical protein